MSNVVFVDAEDNPPTIGRRARQIRKTRKKSLRVIAGLAGISAASLSRIETRTASAPWTATQRSWT